MALGVGFSFPFLGGWGGLVRVNKKMLVTMKDVCF